MVTRITDLRTQGDYTSLDDRMLVLDFQAGQPEAFVEIHRRYGQLARHVCQRFLPNRADADEAFQETMIRVYQGLHRFNGQYALQPWVARIATNVSLDQIRTRARRPQVDDGALDEHDHRDPSFGPDEMLERLIERDLVLSVLGGLPPSHRTALVLRELEGRSHKEIAEALNITPAQAKALIHRAKMSFRKNWLIAVTEKGGLAGIAILPLMLVVKVLDGARKVVDRIGGHAAQVVQVATPEVVSSAASSPTTVNLASSMTERVVAAGMTLLRRRGRHGRAPPRSSSTGRDRDQGDLATPPAARWSPRRLLSPHTGGRSSRPDGPGEYASRSAAGPAGGQPGPGGGPPGGPLAGDPGTSPSPLPRVPTSSPSGDPSPEPPAPPPAPDWSYAFSSSTESVEVCACDATTHVAERPRRTSAERVHLLANRQGGALDDRRRPAWLLYLEFEGTAGAERRHPHLLLRDQTRGPEPPLRGSGISRQSIAHEDGSTVYSFEGTLPVRPDQHTVGGLPAPGPRRRNRRRLVHGTIYPGSFSLAERRHNSSAEGRNLGRLRFVICVGTSQQPVRCSRCRKGGSRAQGRGRGRVAQLIRPDFRHSIWRLPQQCGSRCMASGDRLVRRSP